VVKRGCGVYHKRFSVKQQNWQRDQELRYISYDLNNLPDRRNLVCSEQNCMKLVTYTEFLNYFKSHI